jgi:aryl-alcohol dehydrogenase-like predicted oxidoreductase
MDTLVQQGKVLYWGTSEWPATLIREAHRVAKAHHLHAPTMEQPQYNLLQRERVELEYAPLYAELGLGTTTFSPLASGLLTGKYADASTGEPARLEREGMGWLKRLVVGDEGQRRPERAARFADAARALGHPPATLAIAWCLRNPHVSSVILGASRVSQLLQNLQAIDVVGALDEANWQRIEAAAA